jgi:hypothetical protein
VIVAKTVPLNRCILPSSGTRVNIGTSPVRDADPMSNDRRYWFPAKRYGWGWGPPRHWQGWAVLVVWLGAIMATAFALLPQHRAGFLLSVLAMSGLLLAVCYAKGEPPAWRWGESDAGNRDR